MNVRLAEGKITSDGIDDVRAAAQKLFAALDAARPEGVRYAWFLRPDGETFVAFVQVDDDLENPIPSLPEFRELQKTIEGRLAEPPNAQPLTVVGSYRLV